MASTALTERGSSPGPHPEPPADMDERALPLCAAPSLWYRIHRSQRDAVHFGRAARFRFDDPAGRFGVLYLAADPQGAFIETFGHGGAGAPRVVTGRTLAERTLSRVHFVDALHLVDLTGPGLAQLSADARLCTGDYKIAQRWAAALEAHPDAPDGLLYRSRHDPSRLCSAIFDRAPSPDLSSEVGCLFDPAHAQMLAALLDRYDVGLLD